MYTPIFKKNEISIETTLGERDNDLISWVLEQPPKLDQMQAAYIGDRVEVEAFAQSLESNAPTTTK